MLHTEAEDRVCPGAPVVGWVVPLAKVWVKGAQIGGTGHKKGSCSYEAKM